MMSLEIPLGRKLPSGDGEKGRDKKIVSNGSFLVDTNNYFQEQKTSNEKLIVSTRHETYQKKK